MTRPDLTEIQPNVAEYITSLEAQIENITQTLRNLQRLYFGRKSEKIRIPAPEVGMEQLCLFEQDEQQPAVSASEEMPAVKVVGHSRKKKRTQKEIIANLPTIVHEHTIAEDERCCPRCGNEELEYIGKELVYTEYMRVPAHVDKHEHYVVKYACHACENGTETCKTCNHAESENCATCPYKPSMMVVAAQLPEEFKYPLIKGSKASPSILAQVCYDKFNLAIPEYRQEKEWERLGFPLSRQTMSNWVLRADKSYFQAMTEHMLKKLKTESTVIHCDETETKVLDEKNDKGNLKKCHMWVMCSGKLEEKQVVVFSYRNTRAGHVPPDLLEGYDKFFVVDGYSGYNGLAKQAIRCGCLAHLRRKFFDSIPDHNLSLPSAGREGVRYCDKLFEMEARLENATPEERLRVRQAEAPPILEEFYAWLDTAYSTSSHFKEAVTFAKNQKKNLLRFLEDGRIPLTNSVAENAIRPFVIGRKNWLFCKSNDGAVAAANVYSIIETAKANNLDVLKYLNYILRRVPKANAIGFTDEFLESLMPWNESVQAECQRGYI